MPYTREEIEKLAWDRWVKVCKEAGLDPEAAGKEVIETMQRIALQRCKNPAQ